MASENSLILSFDSLEKILSKYSTAFFLHVHSFIDVLKMTTDDYPLSLAERRALDPHICSWQTNHVVS